MKNKKTVWYFGYAVAAVLVAVMFFTDLPEMVDIALGMVFAVVLSVSHVQIMHQKMLETEADYRVEVMDERNILIKEKAGNVGNMVNLLLMGCATVVFRALKYTVPAIIMGVIVCIQPLILIGISNWIEKRM